MCSKSAFWKTAFQSFLLTLLNSYHLNNLHRWISFFFLSLSFSYCVIFTWFNSYVKIHESRPVKLRGNGKVLFCPTCQISWQAVIYCKKANKSIITLHFNKWSRHDSYLKILYIQILLHTTQLLKNMKF